MASKRQMADEENTAARKHSKEEHGPLNKPEAEKPGDALQRAKTNPKNISSQAVQQLQRAVGNRAVRLLIHHAAQTNNLQRLFVDVSGHYNSDADELHARAKTLLEAADSGLGISHKIFKKFVDDYQQALKQKRKPREKCVSRFKTSDGGFLVVVTRGFVKDDTLIYDTAYLAKTVGDPESSAIDHRPEAPVFTVG